VPMVEEGYLLRFCAEPLPRIRGHRFEGSGDWWVD